MREVSIVVCTKNSPTFADCVSTIKKNTTYPNYKIIVSNAGNKITNNFLDFVNLPADSTLIQQITAGVNKAEDFVTVMCDDHFPQKDWLTFAIKEFLTHFKDDMGCLILNEGLGYNGRKACLVLTTKKYINEALAGELYDRRFIHFRCDKELAERLEIDSRFKYCEESKIIHKHTITSLAKWEWNNIFPKDMVTYKKIIEKQENRRLC